MSSIAARSLLPFLKTAYFPHKKSFFEGAKSSPLIFTLLRYAPPSLTMRRAADFESTTPAAVMRSTHVGISSFLEIVARGNSASALVSVASSSSPSSPCPNSARAAASTRCVVSAPWRSVVSSRARAL